MRMHLITCSAEEIKSKTKAELEMLRDVLGLKTIQKEWNVLIFQILVKQLLWLWMLYRW